MITCIALFLEWQIGILLVCLLIGMLSVIYYNTNRFLLGINVIASKLVKSIKKVQEDAFVQSPIGIMIYDQNERFMWGNNAALAFLKHQDVVGEKLVKIDASFSNILKDTTQQWQIVMYQNHHYKILHQPEYQAIYLIDFEEENELLTQNQFNQIVVGYLLIDDYDELVQSLDDQEKTQFEAMIISDLNKWAAEYDIYIKRIEDEQFMLIMNVHMLEKLEATKFVFVRTLRESYYQKNIPLSISIGIAYPTTKRYKINILAKEAKLNLDLALGRGGDQVVVKSGDEEARFYGGDTNPSQRRTQTRSKLVYQALINQINQASNIIISGHKYPDMDSMGSALGIYKIAVEQKKTAKIVVNEATFNKDIQELLRSPQINYNLKNIFIDVEAAKQYLTSKSLVILVDHHRPSLSEAEELLMFAQNIVIIDHHRRSEEFPHETVLTYIEPYASSTSELVTEFFMNLKNTNESVNRFEATALLAGIIVDTNNFSLRTGYRTFDAASYLKLRGADSVQIQRMLQENLEDVRLRNHLIEQTTYLKTHYAISTGENELIIDNVIAAQAADAMLALNQVEASFVIYRRSENSVGISARSMGTINVQRIMEALGGGGHLSNAATQISDKSTEAVRAMLIEEIEKQSEE